RENQGQAQGFVAQHQLQTDKDWDLSNVKEMLELTQRSVDHIKDSVVGDKVIEDFRQQMVTAVQAAVRNLPRNQIDTVMKDLIDLMGTLNELKKARGALAQSISDGGSTQDPEKALAEIRTSLRLFRYSMQKAALKEFPESQPVDKMGIMEGALRSIQNAFSNMPVTSQALRQIAALEQRVQTLTTRIHAAFDVRDQPAALPMVPNKFTLMSTIGDTLKLSHQTNDQIRSFQDSKSTGSWLRSQLEPISKEGGSHKVTLSVSAGVLLGLGFSQKVIAGIGSSAKLQVEAEVSCGGSKKPLDVTFRIIGGIDAKGSISPTSSVKGELGGAGQLASFATKSYASLDDLILDAKNNKMVAASRSVGSLIFDGVKALGSLVGTLGTRFFRYLGRRSGEVMQTNREYLESLKTQNIVGNLDTVLARRANPVIVGMREGLTSQFNGQISGSFGITNALSVGVSADVQHQQDHRVSGNTFAPIIQSIRGASREQLLAMRRPMAEGGVMPTLENTTANALSEHFDHLVNAARDRRPRGEQQWARFANQLRTLMLNVELLHLGGRITRAEADRLLTRFSNPDIRMPRSIFREYLMEGSGNCKPAKIRTSFSSKIKVSLLSNLTKDLTKNLANVTGSPADTFIKGVADAGVAQMRQETGLDSTIQYSYSTEKPAKPGEDPRPWENVVKTSHTLTVSDSMPFRLLLDATLRVIESGDKALGMPSLKTLGKVSKDLVKDTASSTASGLTEKIIPKLISASVKEGSKAAVQKWLSSEENVTKLTEFVAEHGNDAFGTIVSAVEHIAGHPTESLDVALANNAYSQGSSASSSNEHTKKITFDLEDGELRQLSIYKQSSSSVSVNISPVQLGVSGTFGISHSVSSSLFDKKVMFSTSLTTLMSQAENYMLANTSATAHVAGSQGFKNYLAKSLDVVKQVFAEMSSTKNANLYIDAFFAANGDLALQRKMQEAHQNLINLLPQTDATDEQIVDAMHDLLITMTTAFRSSVPQAGVQA
ncbi:MAG TPA: hypothetical protein DCZ56_07895, partial [Sutterella sp.]|nr:hypothetical protein [Sutterella sp.]